MEQKSDFTWNKVEGDRSVGVGVGAAVGKGKAKVSRARIFLASLLLKSTN